MQAKNQQRRHSRATTPQSADTSNYPLYYPSRNGHKALWNVLVLLALTFAMLAQPTRIAPAPATESATLRTPHSVLHTPQSQVLGNSGSPNGSAYFSVTGKAVRGDFLGTFQHYGLNQIGYPISDETQENGFTVQYFERVRMEYHPELVSKGYGVLLTRLGAEMSNGTASARVAPFQSTRTSAYLPQTGHSLTEPFLSYWQNNGGVMFFGYPLS